MMIFNYLSTSILLEMSFTRRIVTVVLLTIAFRIDAQVFEGRIIYSLEVKNANPKQIPDSIFNMMYSGSRNQTQVFYYKDNKYKSIKIDSETTLIQIYEPATNRIYSFSDGSEVGFWFWNSIESQFESSTTKDVVIMGLPCNDVTIKTLKDEMTLFYSEKYSIDVSKFKENNLWEKYLRIAKAVPLKYVVKGEGARHVVILTATQIIPEKLDDDIFRIPKFKRIMKSPF